MYAPIERHERAPFFQHSLMLGSPSFEGGLALRGWGSRLGWGRCGRIGGQILLKVGQAGRAVGVIGAARHPPVRFFSSFFWVIGKMSTCRRQPT